MEKQYNFWPICPTFLSLRNFAYKGIPFVNNERGKGIYSPNEVGIFSSDELRGFLADASDHKDIKNSLSLFQVVPKDFDYKQIGNRIKEVEPIDKYVKAILGERRIIRIDPDNLYSNFSCCDLFRKCNRNRNRDLCFQSDSRIGLLYDSRLSEINNDFKTFYSTLNTIIDEYNWTIKEEFQLKLCIYEDNRVYIRYKCKYSQLYEYFFPIFYQGKVIAILMQGQRFHKNLKREDIFNGYIENSNAGLKLQRAINQIGKKRFEEEPMSEERLKAIIGRIQSLERRISNEINAAAQSYISDCFSSWRTQFHKRINKIDSDSGSALADYKQALDNTLQEICEVFNKDGFIRIYSRVPPMDETNPNIITFELIGDSSSSKKLSNNRLQFKSVLDKVKGIVEKDILLQYIVNQPVGFMRDIDVFRLEADISSKKAYIIWKRYNCKTNDTHFEMYGEALKAIYPTFLKDYFILSGLQSEQKLEASMRISVHESAQIIPTVIDAINNDESLEVLRTGKSYNASSKIELPINNVLNASNRLLLLEELFRRPTLIFKKEPPKKKWHDLHRIIYSAKSLFENKVFAQNMQALIIYKNMSFSSYQLYTDDSYLSQILFNLLDNAIKYGLRGSQIIFDINLKNNHVIKNVFNKYSIQYIRISVVSYGDKISEETLEHMYDLYYRDYSRSVEGMGIGLFLVKKLCNLLEYTIECKSVQECDINVPLHFFYCQQNNVENTTLEEPYKSLLKRSISCDIIGKVVNHRCRPHWEVTDEEFKTLIERQTYRNEFVITIPTDTNNLKTRLHEKTNFNN